MSFNKAPTKNKHGKTKKRGVGYTRKPGSKRLSAKRLIGRIRARVV